jgi:hypothetical protein
MRKILPSSIGLFKNSCAQQSSSEEDHGNA